MSIATEPKNKAASKLKQDLAKAQKEIKALRAELKNSKTSIKISEKQAKKIAKEAKNVGNDKLQASIDAAFEKGYEMAVAEIEKIDRAFDLHMEKAAEQFDKLYAKKMQKVDKKSNKKNMKKMQSSAAKNSKNSKNPNSPKKTKHAESHTQMHTTMTQDKNEMQKPVRKKKVEQVTVEIT